MSQTLRHPEILDLARRDGKVTVEGLARHFGVTLQTVRRDLSELAGAGRLDRRAAADLADAYVFLRNLEHRLQMVADRQTHRLPEDAAGLARIASFMGFAGSEAFADHYPYDEGDMQGLLATAAKLEAVPVTTRKDWVRIPLAYRQRVEVVSVSLTWEDPVLVDGRLGDGRRGRRRSGWHCAADLVERHRTQQPARAGGRHRPGRPCSR